ncbi:MAG: hypothetical protein LBV12_00515 [Puniceicoccales bacterium]|jgi:hypothetical protein|nr:hypothetical protein [Puniceicoccales bacterium]
MSLRRSFFPALRTLGSVLVLVVTPLLSAQSNDSSAIENKINWSTFLGSKDMTWTKAPTNWDNAPFLGNGVIGMQLMRDAKDKNALRVEVARMDAQEHLPFGEGAESIGWSYARYRMPIGFFSLKTVGEIKDWNLRLSLWDAEVQGTVTTSKGKIALRAYAHATQPLLVVEITPDSPEAEAQWSWNAYASESPRARSWAKDTGKKEAPAATPGPLGSEVKVDGQITAWLQPLRPRGQVATAWQEVNGTEGARIFYISIAHTYPENSAVDTAAATVRHAAATSPAALTDTHRTWWHDFYPNAFLSIPDSYWETFYWIQMYKIGSGMRSDGTVLDLQGPWTGLPVNAWPGVWWNLNVQLTYWPCYTGNRLEAAKSLSNTLLKYRQNLIDNVPEKYRADSAALPRASGHDIRQNTGWPGNGKGASAEVGSLPWACHNLFLQYRMTMDDDFLRDEVFPILRRATNYYIHFLEKGEDGKLHLPPTLSPEYGIAPDCNYDLALLRWGCQTLLWCAARLKINDPLTPQWKDILANLVDYPVDKNGYMIGRGVPFKNSHRHYSHLFMVYPLHLVDTSKPEEVALADKSIRHWHSLKGGLQGYSFSGGASLYATLGWGNEALEMLDGLKRYIRPNTLYRETWPVMETPLSGAASIHDMLLQSHNEVVHVFPAIPDKWQNTVFHDLRA